MALRRDLLALGVVASLSLSLIAAAPAPPRGDGRAEPPLRYSQVAHPISKTKPGKGSTSTSVVYTPANIQAAYNLSALAPGGAGKAVAIVDAYGDPQLSADLAGFDSQFGLAPATVNVYYPDGAPTTANSNWAVETALDVEWAHANAQGATIDLVIVPDSGYQHLLDGVMAAAGLGVSAISMSWGGSESSFATSGYLAPFESAFQAAAANGILLFASSGDKGAYNGSRRTLNVNYPASSPQVTGVGGTTLTLSGAGGYGGEKAWSDSGGGYSVEFGEPAYQSSAAISDSKGTRGVPDVAFDANPSTGVYVLAQGSWYGVGGTSVGSPNWAAIATDNAALAGTGSPLGGSAPLSLQDLYAAYESAYSADFHDITSGSNGYYSAGPGWDAVTGIGSPNGANLIAGY